MKTFLLVLFMLVIVGCNLVYSPRLSDPILVTNGFYKGCLGVLIGQSKDKFFYKASLVCMKHNTQFTEEVELRDDVFIFNSSGDQK